MEFFTKKLFDGTSDKFVHLQFQKYSRGEFKNKAMIIAKSQVGGKFSINTTTEYANELVRFLAEKLGGEITHVTGIVVSTRDLTGELDFQNKKQFMGVKQYILDREMTGDEILALCEKLPNSFIGLSFKVGDTELKIKPKAPKSAKPSTKGEEKPKVDFCKIKTKDKDLVDGLIFDVHAGSFKVVEIGHEFNINEVVITDEMKVEAGEDYAKIREMAKKKGKIVRKIEIDGQEFIEEKEFIV
jgi:hypothetical protein